MRSSYENRAPGRPGSGDRLLRAAVRRAGWWLVPLVLLATLGAAATLALPALLGRAVDQLVTTAARSGAPTWSAAGGPLVATAALVLLVVVVDVVTQLVAGGGTAVATGRLRHDLARHVLAAGPRLAPGTAEGDLVTRLVSSTATAGRAVVIVGGMAAAVLPPAGAVVALALIDPWLAVTFAVGMASVSGVVRTYLRGAHAATAGYLDAQGTIAARMVDALAGARSIAAARTTDVEVDRVLGPLDELRRQGAAVWHNIARLAFRGEPVILLTQVAVIAVAGTRLAAGRLTPGELLAASRYAVMAAGIGGMLDDLAALTRARAGAARVAEVMDEPIPRYGTAPLPAGPGGLELRGITAGTTGRAGDGAQSTTPVVQGLDLSVPGGAVVALVGRSGAGKSLVAALAGRLCDPTRGTVLLDGVPLRNLDRVTLRRAVAYAFERPGLLHGTVADALRFGVDVPPPDRIRAASRAARADRFIARLPHGYAADLAETPLSGGELQRIGLARALAHEARVLILDDATSSLDTATEAEITEAITAQLQGRTRLVVTHRRATAARADLVAWLDGGRIRACAPHTQLWDDPAYRAVFQPEPVPDPTAPPVPDDDPANPGDPVPHDPIAATPAPLVATADHPAAETPHPGTPEPLVTTVDAPVAGPDRPIETPRSGAPEPLIAVADGPVTAPRGRVATPAGPTADVGDPEPLGAAADEPVVGVQAGAEGHRRADESSDRPEGGTVDVRDREPQGAGGIGAVVVTVGSPATAGSE